MERVILIMQNGLLICPICQHPLILGLNYCLPKIPQNRFKKHIDCNNWFSKKVFRICPSREYAVKDRLCFPSRYYFFWTLHSSPFYQTRIYSYQTPSADEILGVESQAWCRTKLTLLGKMTMLCQTYTSIKCCDHTSNPTPPTHTHWLVVEATNSSMATPLLTMSE